LQNLGYDLLAIQKSIRMDEECITKVIYE
jgi:hypothetical protein